MSGEGGEQTYAFVRLQTEAWIWQARSLEVALISGTCADAARGR
jgi:hypothetical protein